MPQGGFICPKTHDRVDFEICFRGGCLMGLCHPLPVLAGCANERPVEPGVYHTTEILNPPRVVYLSRHETYFLSPESGAYSALGTGYHLLMEASSKKLRDMGISDDALLEQGFSTGVTTEFGTATLTGKADRYEPGPRTLYDYKTEKLYSVQQYMAGRWNGVKHVYQLNIYRTFLFPEAQRLVLSCNIKDHGFRALHDGIPAIVEVEVPIIESHIIREYVAAKIGILLLNEKDPTTIRDCQDDELWGGKRCLEYCPVVAFCPQGQAITGKGSGANGGYKKNKAPS